MGPPTGKAASGSRLLLLTCGGSLATPGCRTLIRRAQLQSPALSQCLTERSTEAWAQTGSSQIGWGVQRKRFRRKGSYHMASVERRGIKGHVGTRQLEGGCISGREGGSISDLLLLPDSQILSVGQSVTFHPYLSRGCSSWLQNSDPLPSNLKAD